MAKIKINGDSSGYVEIAAPNAANNNTLELGPGTKILTDSDPLSDIGSIGIATDNPGSGNILAAYGRTQLGPQSDASDATTKAEMISKASLRVKPHPTNSGALNFAQVDSGDSIGIQYTNGSGSANWDIALQPFGGKVAIGTDSPNKVLKVEYPDPGSGSDGLTQKDTGNDTTTFFGTVGPSYNYIGHQGHAGMVYSSRDLAIGVDHNNNGVIKFYTGNNERLRITSGGTLFSYSPDDTTPNFKFRSNDTNWHGALNQSVHGATITTFLSCGGDWDANGTTYSCTKNLAAYPSSAIAVHNQYNNSWGSEFVFLTKAGGSTTTDGAVTERLRIDSAGGVGIGTEDPTYGQSTPVSTYNPKLGVEGSIIIGNLSTTASDRSELQFYRRAGTYSQPIDTHDMGRIAWYGSSNDSNNANLAWSIGVNPDGGTWTSGSNRKGYMTFNNHDGERLRITSNGDLVTSNITISGFSNTHNIPNYSVFLSDNHANTFFGQNLRLDFDSSTNSGNHQLKVINQHATVGGAGILIGGNQSPYINQLKFYTVAANQPAGTRVDDVAARMTIDTSGRVTTPNQPAFCVYRNVSSFTLSAGDTFVFNTAEFNVGSHYNTSNGRFTAPVTGTYVFHFYSIYTGNASNDYIQMYKNGARLNVGDVHFTNSVGSAWDAVHYSRVIQLDVNDYVYMRTGSGHTFHGNNWGGWSGYMLG